MKTLITYFKMMKYALQAKLILVLTLFFFIFGIVFELLDFTRAGSSYSLAALYLALTGMYFYQLVFSSTVSKLVQSSPLKKKLQTSGPILASLILSLLVFAIYVVIRLFRITPEFLEENETSYAQGYSTILFMGVCIFVFFIYLAFSYKTYIFSLIFVGVTIIGILGFGITTTSLVTLSEKLMIDGNNPILIIMVSAVLIVLGAVLGYIISLLLYKKPISDLAVRYALRQASK